MKASPRFIAELALAGSLSTGELWPGGRGVVFGDNMGASPALELSVDGGLNWHLVSQIFSSSHIAVTPQSVTFDAPGCLLRLNGSAGANANVYAALI